jgi:hypothetical protein
VGIKSPPPTTLGLPPPLPELELVALVPPDWELLTVIPPAWDWIWVGTKLPPTTTLGLPLPLPLLELVGLVPLDWELMAEAEVAIVPVGIGFAVTGEVGSGFFSAGFSSPCGFFVAGFMTRAVWPLAFSRASAGVLCSAVVTSMAAPSAQTADVVKSLESFMDVLLAFGLRRHSPPLSDKTPQAAVRFANGDRSMREVQDVDLNGLRGRGNQNSSKYSFCSHSVTSVW